MTLTVLYSEAMYPDEAVEVALFGPDVRILMRDADAISELSDEDCARADGLMLFRHWLTAADLERFPRLRAVVRMGVGYDRLDRVEAERRGVVICNVPDYGTTEVADHAMALAMSLRRGILLHHDRQRATPPNGLFRRPRKPRPERQSILQRASPSARAENATLQAYYRGPTPWLPRPGSRGVFALRASMGAAQV